MKMTEDIIVYHINATRSIRSVEKQMIQIKFYATNVLKNLFKRQEESSLTRTIIKSSNARDARSTRESPKLSLIVKLISCVRDALRIKNSQLINDLRKLHISLHAIFKIELMFEFT